MQAALDQSPDDGLARPFIMKGKSTRFSGKAVPGHGAVHPLDHITSGAKLPQSLLECWLQPPAARRNLVCQAHAFEFCGAADEMLVGRVGDPLRIGAQVDYAAEAVTKRLQLAIKTGPAIGLHLAGQASINVLLGPCAQFHGHQLRGTSPHALADVAAVDNQVAAIVGLAAYQNVDVGIVGVPMVNGDPVETCAKIPFHLAQQVSGKAPHIGQFGRVFGRNNETEMVTVIGAALGEGSAVDGLVAAAEQRRILPVAGHAIALEIGQVLCQRRGSEASPAMPHDPRLDDHTALTCAGACLQACDAASGKATCATSRCGTTRPAAAA